MITLLVCSIAIANLVTLLTGLESLESIRIRLAKISPFLGKLSSCTLCQSFWLSLACVILLPVGLFGWVGLYLVAEKLICWMFLHALSMAAIQAMAKILD